MRSRGGAETPAPNLPTPPPVRLLRPPWAEECEKSTHTHTHTLADSLGTPAMSLVRETPEIFS